MPGNSGQPIPRPDGENHFGQAGSEGNQARSRLGGDGGKGKEPKEDEKGNGSGFSFHEPLKHPIPGDPLYTTVLCNQFVQAPPLPLGD